MLHTYCDVVEQITVRLAPYVAIATNPVRQAYVMQYFRLRWPITVCTKPIIITMNMIMIIIIITFIVIILYYYHPFGNFKLTT
jgi:hypothetical protein